MHVICTGHRPPRLAGDYVVDGQPWQKTDQAVKSRHFFFTALEGIKKQTTNLFAASGMAQGADWLFCKACIGLQIPFKAFVPHPAFASKWPLQAQSEFGRLVADASEVRYTDQAWYLGIETKRDKQLVDWAKEERDALLLAIWDDIPEGGSFFTIKRARNRNLNIWSLNPKNGLVTREPDERQIDISFDGNE
jgi:hypothetical protein